MEGATFPALTGGGGRSGVVIEGRQAPVLDSSAREQPSGKRSAAGRKAPTH